MFDMSWGEVMLIGGVALIVIGPKDLPKALRTVGQITTKLRRMAGEFQSQFNEAIREAELDEVRRDVDGIKRSMNPMGPVFDPVQTIRNEIKGAVEGTAAKPEAAPSPQTLADATAQLRAAEADGSKPPGHEAAQADRHPSSAPSAADPLAAPPGAPPASDRTRSAAGPDAP